MDTRKEEVRQNEKVLIEDIQEAIASNVNKEDDEFVFNKNSLSTFFNLAVRTAEIAKKSIEDKNIGISPVIKNIAEEIKALDINLTAMKLAGAFSLGLMKSSLKPRGEKYNTNPFKDIKL